MSGLQPPPGRYEYEHDGQAIYTASFATIRAETDLSTIPPDAEKVAVRMVHASGQTDLTRDLGIHDDLVSAARGALLAGAPILCDAHMGASGVTRSRLPRDNEVLCTLRDPRVPGLAAAWGTTRSAAAVSLWADQLDGADETDRHPEDGGRPRRSGVDHLQQVEQRGRGVADGHHGAAESKDALASHPAQVPYLVVRGRRGGSAMAASAVNALAQDPE